MNRKQIPVTVLGGYLGAGKTTILNRLLSRPNKDGASPRLAVLINDFGPINLDAALISSRSDSLIELSNGCICCSLAEGFAVALDTIRERAATDPTSGPEHLVIETSGVALPRSVAQYAHLPGFRLDTVVIAVDLEQISDLVNDRRIGETVRTQIGSADLVLATKQDLVDGSTLADSLETIRQFTAAPTVPVSSGQIPFETVIGVSDQVLSDHVLSDHVLSDQVLTDHELSDQVLSDHELSGDAFSSQAITSSAGDNQSGHGHVGDSQSDDSQSDNARSDNARSDEECPASGVRVRAEMRTIDTNLTKDAVQALLREPPISCLRIKGFVRIEGRVHRADRVGSRITVRVLPQSDADGLDDTIIGQLLFLHLED